MFVSVFSLLFFDLYVCVSIFYVHFSPVVNISSPAKQGERCTICVRCVRLCEWMFDSSVPVFCMFFHFHACNMSVCMISVHRVCFLSVVCHVCTYIRICVYIHTYVCGGLFCSSTANSLIAEPQHKHTSKAGSELMQ